MMIRAWYRVSTPSELGSTTMGNWGKKGKGKASREREGEELEEEDEVVGKEQMISIHNCFLLQPPIIASGQRAYMLICN